MPSVIRRTVISLAVLVVVAAAWPASAEVREGSFELEFFGGWYDPGTSVLPGAPTLGGRFGYNATQRFFVQGSLGFAQFERDVADGGNSGTVQLDLWDLDFSFGYNFTVDGGVTPEVHAGFGGGFGSLSGALQVNDTEICGLSCTVTFENLSENSFTLHAGAGVRIDLSHLLYLRPVVRTRWFAERDEDQWDVEYTVSLGFKFGGH